VFLPDGSYDPGGEEKKLAAWTLRTATIRALEKICSHRVTAHAHLMLTLVQSKMHDERWQNRYGRYRLAQRSSSSSSKLTPRGVVAW
jgi:hypothetical protein